MRLHTFVIFCIVISSTASAEMLRASKNSEVEKSMHRVQAEVRIKAPIEMVWSIVGENFDQSSKFNVNAKETLYLKREDGFVGSQRRTINNKDKVMDVEITKYSEGRTYVKWEIYHQNVAHMKAGNA